MRPQRPQHRGDTWPTDRELLADYVSNKSPEVFAEIIKRYTQLVFAVCFRILKDAHLAEDAAQATFVTLMQKASRLSSSTDLAADALESWSPPAELSDAVLAEDSPRGFEARLRKNDSETCAFLVAAADHEWRA